MIVMNRYVLINRKIHIALFLFFYIPTSVINAISSAMSKCDMNKTQKRDAKFIFVELQIK